MQLHPERPPAHIETELIKDTSATRETAGTTSTLRGRDLRVRPVKVDEADAAKLILTQRNEALYATVGVRKPREMERKKGTIYRGPVRPSAQLRSASSSRVSVFTGDRLQTGLDLRVPFTAINRSQTVESPRVFTNAGSRQMSLSGTVRSELPVLPSSYDRSYSYASAASTLRYDPHETGLNIIRPEPTSFGLPAG